MNTLLDKNLSNNRNITFLHVSDLHICNNNLSEIKKIINEMFKDIDRLKKQNIIPNFILFTGDIVHEGKNADEFNLANDNFINPLLKYLNLTTNELILIPGNHEVDRTKLLKKIDEDIDKYNISYQKVIERTNKIKKDTGEKSYIISKFNNYLMFHSKLLNKNRIHQSILYDAYKIKYSNFSIGIIGFNSAWNSSIYHRKYENENDKGNMILTKETIEESSARIHDSDIKIALMHHPLDYQADWNRSLIKESIMRNFDFLLHGHKHDVTMELTQSLFGDIKIFISKGLKTHTNDNGYSILNFDFNRHALCAYFRKWIENRNEFDTDIDHCKNGEYKIYNFQFKNINTNQLLEISALRNQIDIEDLQTDIFFPVDENLEYTLRDIFVEPIIADKSTLDYNKINKKEHKLIDILDKNQNIIFVGREEFGKTTLLRFIKSEIIKKDTLFGNFIPVIFNFSDFTSYHDNFIKTIIKKSLNINILEEKIDEYLNNGNFIFLIDDFNNIEDDNRNKIEQNLNKVFQKYNKCRFILTINESIKQVFKNENIKLKNEFEINTFYLHSFNTKRIRLLLEKWCSNMNIDTNKFIEQITDYFSKMCLPVTPLSITLLLGVLLDDKAGKGIKNEAYLMDNYFNYKFKRLEKKSTRDIMDIHDKKKFIAHMAFNFYNTNKYEWYINDFDQEKINYFNKLGETIPNQSIIDEFFKIGIFTKNNNMIRFKFKKVFHYFLAMKSFLDRDREELINNILSRKDYLNFSSTLSYQAGLTRNNIPLLFELEKRAKENISLIFNDIKDEKLLEKLELENGLLEYFDKIKKELEGNNNNIYKDQKRDERSLSYNDSDQDIEKDMSKEDQFDDIFRLITLNSEIIRNTQMELSQKMNSIRNNIFSYKAIMLVGVQLFKDFFENVDRDELIKFLFDKKQDDNDKVKTEEIINQIRDFFFQIIPTSIIYYLSDHLANPKMTPTILEIIKNEKDTTNKLIYSLLLYHNDIDSAIKLTESTLKDKTSYIFDNVTCFYLTIFCKLQDINDKNVNKIVSIMGKIRDKHSTKKKPKDLFYSKDDFHSSKKKNILQSKLKKD